MAISNRKREYAPQFPLAQPKPPHLHFRMSVLRKYEFCGRQCRSEPIRKHVSNSRIQLPASLAYPCLKGSYLLIRHRVSLSDDRDKIDLGVESTHELNVDRLEPIKRNVNMMG